MNSGIPGEPILDAGLSSIWLAGFRIFVPNASLDAPSLTSSGNLGCGTVTSLKWFTCVLCSDLVISCNGGLRGGLGKVGAATTLLVSSWSDINLPGGCGHRVGEFAVEREGHDGLLTWIVVLCFS